MTAWGDAGAPAFAAVVVAPAFGADEAEQAIVLAGGAIAGRIGWDALDGLGARATGRPVLVIEAERQAGPEFEGRLAQLAETAAQCDLQLVVALDEAAIDPVAAALMGANAQLLCAPTMLERVAALALAARRGTAGPAARETEAERLRHLNEEVARIAQALARLTDQPVAGNEAVEDRRRSFGAEPPDMTASDPQAIRRAIRTRRLRDAFFPAGLFEDPVWDMLLDLYAAELEDNRVSVSSLCIAAAVAPTTALRWITRMADLGLVRREPDPADRRRAFIALTDAGRGGMRSYLAALGRAGSAIA